MWALAWFRGDSQGSFPFSTGEVIMVTGDSIAPALDNNHVPGFAVNKKMSANPRCGARSSPANKVTSGIMTNGKAFHAGNLLSRWSGFVR